MTTQAAAQAAAQPAGAAIANGSGSAGTPAAGTAALTPAAGAAAMSGGLAIKKEVSPVPDGAGGAPAAAAGAAGSRGGTPDVRLGASASASPAAAAGAPAAAAGTPEAGAAAAAAGGTAGAADAPPTKEEEEQRRLEDEILAEGQAIAGVRALLAKAFSRPAEEPAAPRGHWSFLLQEMQWLANDMAQERLWKQAAALAIGHEVAKLGGKFGLRPPPEGQRKYHDEIAALRAAAAKDGGAAAAAAADKQAGGRRSAARASGSGAGGGEANGAAGAAAALKLDPADDPVFREFSFAAELALPGTPPNDDLTAALTFQHDDAFQEALAAQLLQSDVERMMREEVAAREYRFEYEAALASHHMAVADQNRRAMRLDADMADAEGLVPMDEDVADEEDYAGKKAKNRKRARSGYLLDEFASLGPGAADETESAGGAPPKKQVTAGVAGTAGAAGASRQFIEDTYLQRKRRRERYKDVDVDYDVGMETAGRYGTRANRAMATRAGATRAQDPNKRKQQLGRVDSFAPGGGVPGGGAGGGGAMMRGGQRMPQVPGPVIWNKQEDDLLLAITHEFGVNWTMVSEVLSLSLSMQGIFRPPHLCKQRFRQITMPILQAQAQAQAPPGQEVGPVDYSEEKALIALYQAMTKQQARELIVQSLPVHDDVMMRMLEALVQVGATAKQRRQAEEKRNEQGRKMQDPHPSHQVVHQAIMGKTGNKHLTPQELAVQVDVAYAQQAKQQQMQLQQAQQAAQLQAQQASAPPQAGQQAGGAAGAPPAQGMPAPGPGVAAGTPAGAPGLPAGAAPGQPQQQGMQGGVATPPLPAGIASGQAMGATPGGGGVQQQQGMAQQGQPGGPMQSPAAGGMAGHPPAPRASQSGITLHQLNHILETGKLPNGQPLEPPMRKAIEDKKNQYLQNMAHQQQQRMQMAAMHQQQQQQQAAQQAAAGGGGPSAATQAALQAAQQAAAVQAGMRPPMGMPGMFRPTMSGQPGMPGAGMPGQPMGGQAGMGMQPALLQQQMAQMAAAGGPGAVGMQGMQPGMQLPPAAQQQFMAQQAYAMQQQAAAAAAAAAQPGQQPGS